MRLLLSIILNLFIIMAAHAADFTLKSAAFLNNQRIPTPYTCDGQDISPQLSWENPPANTQSFVLIMDSPDWSAGLVNFWILFNIPSTMKELVKGANQQLPQEIIALSNFYNEATYRGPCPPDGNEHHYVFTLYALDKTLDLGSDVELNDLMIAIKGHILGQAILTGVYSH